MAVTYLGKTYCGCSPTKSGLKQSKLYGSKPNMIMGVNMFVNSPAQNTENQTNSTQTIKIYPYDFTSEDRRFKTFKLIARTRDIMNAIDGPKIMDININKSNDINIVKSHDGTNQFPGAALYGSVNPQIAGFNASVTVSTREQPKLYCRRDGENANALTAIDYLTANYNEQASRITSNAPSDSMYSYPFVFSNYTLDPALRPLCVDPIIKWYWESYTAPTTPPQVSVLKISTLNTNIQSSTLFPGALVAFPSNAVAVDCSTLSTSSIGKLYKLSPYIIDVSNSKEGLFNAVSSQPFDSDIGLALDHTYGSQDIEFALFLASLYLPNSPSTNAHTIKIDTYRYDPVEAVFSYFSTKKYEFTDNPLQTMAVNTQFRKEIIWSNRLALTYMIQQAAKQMRIWLDPSASLANGTYTSAQINNALNFNTDLNMTAVVAGVYYLFPMWIPYEYVKASNNNIELDKTTWVSGRGNRKIARSCVKPASYLEAPSTNVVYYNKFGQAFNYYTSNNTGLPISIYVPNLPDRCIYTIQSWNDDNLCNYDYLEESDYFPVQDLDTNI